MNMHAWLTGSRSVGMQSCSAQISPFAGNMSLRQLIAEFASDARRDSIVIAKYPSDWGATATTANRFRPLSCAAS